MTQATSRSAQEQRNEPSPEALHREMQAYAAKLRSDKKESILLLKRIGVMNNAGKLSKDYGG